MPFDPTLPVDHSPVVAAELRGQFNALKTLVDGLSAQLAPITPAVTRDVGGNWSLAYTGQVVAGWQWWVSNDNIPEWALVGHLAADAFPLTDADLSPGGVWWQVKFVGENADNLALTPFSNTICFGPVPL